MDKMNQTVVKSDKTTMSEAAGKKFYRNICTIHKTLKQNLFRLDICIPVTHSWVYPREMWPLVPQKICIKMFVIALFIII